MQTQRQITRKLVALRKSARASPQTHLMQFIFSTALIASLFLAALGCWVDYVVRIPFRNPLQWSIAILCVFLYLATIMFYRWPPGLLTGRYGSRMRSCSRSRRF